jgi:hypothetical protein
MDFIRLKNLNPRKYPWNLKNESVSEVFSAFLLNRIPGEERYTFMDELWRVLVPNGKVTMIVPYWTSVRSIQDPGSAWPPLGEQSFLYFNKQWREAQKILNSCHCDFDFVYGYAMDQETAGKNDEVRSFNIKHYNNSVNDVQVTLTKRQ